MSLPTRRSLPRSAVALRRWDWRVLHRYVGEVPLKPSSTWRRCATGLPSPDGHLCHPPHTKDGLGCCPKPYSALRRAELRCGRRTTRAVADAFPSGVCNTRRGGCRSRPACEGRRLTPAAVVCCAGVFCFSVSACFAFRCFFVCVVLFRCPCRCVPSRSCCLFVWSRSVGRCLVGRRSAARPRPDGSRWERRPRVNCGRKSRRGVTGRGRWSAAASSPPHLLHTHQHGSTRRRKQSCTA